MFASILIALTETKFLWKENFVIFYILTDRKFLKKKNFEKVYTYLLTGKKFLWKENFGIFYNLADRKFLVISYKNLEVFTSKIVDWK